jgi:hypothetical protein
MSDVPRQNWAMYEALAAESDEALLGSQTPGEKLTA